LDWVMAPLAECTEDAHQDRLRVGTLIRSVAITVFAHADRRTDFSFIQVVLERDSWLIQKCENVILMSTETFDQTFGMRFFPGGVDQLLQPAGQPMPHLHQPAGSEPHLKVKVEHLDDLREPVAQGKMQPRGEHQRAVAQGRFGQRVGDRRFHFLSALRAPIAMDRVLGDFCFEIFGNVFAVSRSRFLAPLQPAVAVRTAIGAVLLAMIDPLGRSTTAWRASDAMCQPRRPPARPVVWPSSTARR